MPDPFKTSLEAALLEAGEYVARMPATPGARELRGRLDKLRHAVEGWGPVNRPTAQQIDALLEQVTEVRRLATTTAPTVKRKAQP